MPVLALRTHIQLEALEMNTVPAATAADEVLRPGRIHKYVSGLLTMLNFPEFLCCLHPINARFSMILCCLHLKMLICFQDFCVVCALQCLIFQDLAPKHQCFCAV